MPEFEPRIVQPVFWSVYCYATQLYSNNSVMLGAATESGSVSYKYIHVVTVQPHAV